MTNNNFFRKAAAGLAESGNIQEKYIELYAKAMEAALAIGVNLISGLLIGYFCGMWWHCIVLLTAFIPLRSYSGGYHARGYISCYIESCVLLTAALLFIKYGIIQKNMTAEIWQVFLVSVIIIFLLAPLADENKPISEKEAVVFQRRTRIILILEVLLIVIFTCLRVDYSYSMMMAITICAFALVLHRGRDFLKSTRKQTED